MVKQSGHKKEDGCGEHGDGKKENTLFLSKEAAGNGVREDETWLGSILAKRGISAHLIYLCEERLVRQEGFGSAQILAYTPIGLFTRAYLESLGIHGLGLQQLLLDFHVDLRHDYLLEKRRQQQSQSQTGTGGATKSQPHAVAQQHQQQHQQGARAATVTQQAAKPHKEHTEHKEHQQSKDPVTPTLAARLPVRYPRHAERYWFDDQFDNPKPNLVRFQLLTHCKNDIY